MPLRMAITLLVAALITVILFPSSSATHTAPLRLFATGLAAPLQALRTMVTPTNKITTLHKTDDLMLKLLCQTETFLAL
jgi:hypothetical protein